LDKKLTQAYEEVNTYAANSKSHWAGDINYEHTLCFLIFNTSICKCYNLTT
jgi:hypothetical protein